MSIPYLMSRVDYYYNYVVATANTLPISIDSHVYRYLDNLWFIWHNVPYSSDAEINEIYGMIYNTAQQSYKAIETLTSIYRHYTRNLKTSLKAIFNSYLGSTISTLKSAITEISDYIDQQKTSLIQRIVDTTANIYAWSTNQINKLSNSMQNMLDAVYGDIDDEIASVKSIIVNKANEIQTWATGKINEVKTTLEDEYNNTKAWVEEHITDLGHTIASINTQLQYYISSQIELFWNQMVDNYNSLKSWVNDKIDILSNTIDSGFESVYTYINSTINNISSSITSIINTVKETISTLSALSDWRYQFLNLLIFFPELMVMTVLNRSDSLNEHYKPYWKTFLIDMLS